MKVVAVELKNWEHWEDKLKVEVVSDCDTHWIERAEHCTLAESHTAGHSTAVVDQTPAASTCDYYWDSAAVDHALNTGSTNHHYHHHHLGCNSTHQMVPVFQQNHIHYAGCHVDCHHLIDIHQTVVGGSNFSDQNSAG